MTVNDEQLSLETYVRRASRRIVRKHPHGWSIFAGDLFALVVGWLFLTILAFKIPLPVAHIGELNLPVYEVLSVARLLTFVVVFFAFFILGHYTDRIHYFFQIHRVFLVGATAMAVESAFRYYLKEPAGLLWISVSWAILISLIVFLRLLSSNLLNTKERFRQPILIFSSSALGAHLAEAIKRKPKQGFRFAGYARSGWETLDDISRDEITNSFDVEDLRYGRDVLFAFPFEKNDSDLLKTLLQVAEQKRRPVALVAPGTGFRLAGFKELPLFGEDLILLVPRLIQFSLLRAGTKRIFDIFVSFVILLLLLPFNLITAFLISRDGGPVFYSHVRIGRGERHFNCLKFRSMVVDADEKLRVYLLGNAEAAEEWRNTQKLKNDPRISRVGRFLRKTSFDELPQLLNVLIGDMSLVGPRPIVQNEIVKYGENIGEYALVRPGITGLWQVSGRNNTSYDERVELDKWYVRNWSLWLDIFILFKTLPIVLMRRGAY